MPPHTLTKLLTRIFGPRHDEQAADLLGVSARMIRYYKTGKFRVPDRIADVTPELEGIAGAMDAVKKRCK